jgi:hypothetical protein
MCSTVAAAAFCKESTSVLLRGAPLNPPHSPTFLSIMRRGKKYVRPHRQMCCVSITTACAAYIITFSPRVCIDPIAAASKDSRESVAANIDICRPPALTVCHRRRRYYRLMDPKRIRHSIVDRCSHQTINLILLRLTRISVMVTCHSG